MLSSLKKGEVFFFFFFKTSTSKIRSNSLLTMSYENIFPIYVNLGINCGTIQIYMTLANVAAHSGFFSYADHIPTTY